MKPLVRVTDQGLYCEAGNFFIDPWRPVDTAVITHAHSDHSRTGSKLYHANTKSLPFMNHRLGAENQFVGHAYGEEFQIGRAKVSLHPAGHILGSSQVRIEVDGEVWVVSGDYKRGDDMSCDPFEVVKCDVFISEATFALPVYKWENGETLAREVYEWWMGDADRPSLLFGYALGKSQRILAELTRFTDRTVWLHGAVAGLTQMYRDQGIKMLPTKLVSEAEKGYDFKGDLILAPPSGHRSPWMKRFKDPQTAFASGWMAIRGARRRKGYEKGFVLSDHADWNGLIQTIEETKCRVVYLTHGKTEVLERFLKEKGLEVRLFHTEYEDTEEETTEVST